MRSVHAKQLAKQRANFEQALRRSRCPKDKGRILEVSMPNVVCAQCSTKYILAMQSGSFFFRWKLVEEGAQEMVKEKETIQREVIVKLRCRHCGQTFEEALNRCPHCGAPA